MTRHRNLSFYIETLLLTFFLLLALAVLIRTFGAAQRMGQEARQKTDAALILQNVTAEWSAGQKELDQAARTAIEQKSTQTVRLAYGADGLCMPEGDYAVTVSFDAENTQAGALVRGVFSVDLQGQGSEPIACLEMIRYYPSFQEGETP